MKTPNGEMQIRDAPCIPSWYLLGSVIAIGSNFLSQIRGENGAENGKTKPLRSLGTS